jgi:hypothetical protein
MGGGDRRDGEEGMGKMGREEKVGREEKRKKAEIERLR